MSTALVKCGDYYSTNRDAVKVKTSIMRRIPEAILESIASGATNPSEILKYAHVGTRALAAKYLGEVGFIEWLLAEENDWKIDIEISKRKAAGAMVDMAEMDDGGDPKLMGIKFNAAKFLLEFDVGETETPASVTFTMPKKYAHCSIEDIDNELLKLKEG